MSDLLSTIRARIDAELAAAAKVVNERQAALTQALGIESGLEHVKEAMTKFDAGDYPTDEDAAESAAVEGLHWPQPPANEDAAEPPAAALDVGDKSAEWVLSALRRSGRPISTRQVAKDASVLPSTAREALGRLRLAGMAYALDSGAWAAKPSYPSHEDAAPSEPLDPPGTREEILWQLRRYPLGFTSLELQARLALSEAIVDGHLRALRKEGAVERDERVIGSRWVWRAA